MTYDELYAEAKRLNIPGRSKMSKCELEDAVTKAQNIEPLTDDETIAHVPFKVLATYPTHMPNSERVQKYARQNTPFIRPRWSPATGRELGPVKLTPKQMRRVRKNANKHSESFMYGVYGKIRQSEGYSLLARTPEGLGIFHKSN